jgi:hypothetical protein
VEFFPTVEFAQLLFSPWAEYGLLHVLLLGGGDRFVNLVEWFAYIGTIVGVSLIARQFGANSRGQIIAAVFCATVPSLILEASGSMNTAVMAFWIVAFVFFLIAWVRQPATFTGFAVAAAGGLALLTKGPAYFFLPPIVVACWWLGSARSRKLLLLLGPTFILIGLGLNTPQYLRNIELTGQPLGLPFAEATSQPPFNDDRITVVGSISSVLRNAALEMASPSQRLNNLTVAAVSAMIRGIGGDPNDPANTWPDTVWWQGFQLSNDSRHEALAGNPLHFVLFLVVGLVLAFDRGRRFHGAPTLMLGLLAAFILYGILVRWHIWGARYFVVLLVLSGALLGTMLGRMPNVVGSALCSVLLAAGLIISLDNGMRPLLPWPAPSIFQQSREDLYFADSHQQFASSWISAANVVKATSCTQVGLDTGDDLVFYPMMVLLNNDGHSRQIRFAGVDNRTSAYSDGTNPCAVVCLYCASVPAKSSMHLRPGWTRTTVGDVVVFLDEAAHVTPG